MKTPIKIIIADDHTLILDGLAGLIRSITGFELLGQFNSITSLLSFLTENNTPPELFILDVEMPGIDGIQGIKTLKEKFPDSKVLMLTMHDETYFINRAIVAGANGYLLKNSTRIVFEKTITRIMEGSEFVCEMPAREAPPASDSDSETKEITPREVHILKLIAQGKSSKDIAAALFISSRTVDTHRNNLKRKLGLQTSGELVRYAFDHGYL